VILEGEPAQSGRIFVSHLLEFLSNFQKVLYRVGQSVLSNRYGVQKGPKTKDLKTIVAIDLVQITHGSPSTLLCFDKRVEQLCLPGLEDYTQIFETVFKGLEQAQNVGTVLPIGFGRGVLFAWRDMGKLFHKQIKSITFNLSHRPQTVEVKYTPEGFNVIQQRIDLKSN